MEDQNNNRNITSISQSQHQKAKAHVPCPNCNDRLYVDNPELELFNTLNISAIIASHSPVQCKGCGKFWVPAITNQIQIVWGLLPIEKPEEDNLIIVPSLDQSKLKLT